ERRLLPVEGDHLPVEQQIPRLLRRDRRAYLRIGARELLAGARLEPHLVTGFAREAALTVELALEQPVLAELASVAQRRQHRLERHAGIIPNPRRCSPNLPRSGSLEGSDGRRLRLRRVRVLPVVDDLAQEVDELPSLRRVERLEQLLSLPGERGRGLPLCLPAARGEVDQE